MAEELKNIKDIAPPTPSPKPEMSKGEKNFNWLTYTGLNYWVNLISSIAIADYFTHEGSSGRKYLNSTIEKLTLAVEKVGVPLKAAHFNSKFALEFLTFTSGGWLLIAPMKWLEDNKRECVHWLNDKMGAGQTAHDAHKLTPEEIHIEEEQPHQSWGNVIWRRLQATAAIVGSGMAVEHLLKDKNTPIAPEKYVIGGREIAYNAKVLGGKDRSTNFIVGLVNKGLKYLPAGEKIIAHAPAQRWLAIAALDTFFTKITEVVMFATRGAKPEKNPNEIDKSKDAPSHDVMADSRVPDAVIEKEVHFAEKVGKREAAKPIEKKTIEKKSIAPEEFLGLHHGDGAPAMTF